MTRDPLRIRRLIDATWPAVSILRHGLWTLRDGAGGGNRVSAATTQAEDADLAAAETAMEDDGRDVIFAVAAQQRTLDLRLAERGYLRVDPTRLYRSSVAALREPQPGALTGFSVWPPLQIQRDLWTAGGVGPARQAVMERAAHPKTALLGRGRDQPAATAFVALHDGVAMLHALEVRSDMRRQGTGAVLVRHAAKWAEACGADTLTLLVTEANVAANALYRSLGMTSEPCYHYRVRP